MAEPGAKINGAFTSRWGGPTRQWDAQHGAEVKGKVRVMGLEEACYKGVCGFSSNQAPPADSSTCPTRSADTSSTCLDRVRPSALLITAARLASAATQVLTVGRGGAGRGGEGAVTNQQAETRISDAPEWSISGWRGCEGAGTHRLIILGFSFLFTYLCAEQQIFYTNEIECIDKQLTFAHLWALAKDFFSAPPTALISL